MQESESRISIEEYFRLLESAQIKYEYVDGYVFAMTGGTLAHGLITTNISTILNSQLKRSGCRVYTSDALVRIDATNSFYFPDVVIDCGEYDKLSLYTKTPSVIFEVLSRSTATTDRREKMMAYKRIPTLDTYIIVQQAWKSIEIHRRVIEDKWTIEALGPGGDFVLDLCSGRTVKVAVNEIYEDSELDDVPDLQVQEEAGIYAW